MTGPDNVQPEVPLGTIHAGPADPDAIDGDALEKQLRALAVEGEDLQLHEGDDENNDNEEVKASSDVAIAAAKNDHQHISLMPEEQWNEHWNSNLSLLKELYPSFPEHELRNFLIYVHGDMKRARERLNACQAWRRAHLPIPRASVLKPLRQGLFYVHGLDAGGRPVCYFGLQNHDRKDRDVDEYVKAVVYQSEKLVERMGTSDYRVTIVIDRRGANIFNQDIELYKAFFKTFAELYPMKLYRVLLYPSTTVTRVLWSMLRPFVHIHVQRRLVLASRPAQLMEYIPADQLVKDFGGESDYDFRQDI